MTCSITRPALQGFFSPCWGLFDAVCLRACLLKTTTDVFICATLYPQDALQSSSSDASLSSDDEEQLSREYPLAF